MAVSAGGATARSCAAAATLGARVCATTVDDTVSTCAAATLTIAAATTAATAVPQPLSVVPLNLLLLPTFIVTLIDGHRP